MFDSVAIIRVGSIIAGAAALVALVAGNWAIGLCLVAIAGLLVWHLRERNRLLEPIDQFVKAAQEIEQSAFGQPTLPGHLSDDWRPLSEAFKQMFRVLSKREAGLLNSSASLETVLASIGEGVLAIDKEGNLVLANYSACQMLVMNEQNVVGRKLVEQIRIPELTSAIEKAQAEGIRLECEFQTLSEPRRTICATLTSLESSNVSVAVMMHDVTGIRQLETMRRDFVANVSHELKTPLSVIKAYAETLKMGAINDQERNIEFVDQIELQASLLDRQIQDLMQIAQIESGQANLEITVLDMNALCRECHQQLRAIASKREIDFSLELTDQTLNVTGDAQAFRAILTNLISNALQYTPQGSVTIRSELQNKRVAVEVIDTGIGISVGQQARIFERFYRADKARSRDMGGTGLGLAIVKHLTTALGGEVSVESKIGKGSVFRVEFPCAP